MHLFLLSAAASPGWLNEFLHNLFKVKPVGYFVIFMIGVIIYNVFLGLGRFIKRLQKREKQGDIPS